MRSIKRIFTLILILIFVVLAVGVVFLNHLKTRAVPDYNRDVDLENLELPVTVFRDSLGIPQIYASNEEDLYRKDHFSKDAVESNLKYKAVFE